MSEIIYVILSELWVSGLSVILAVLGIGCSMLMMQAYTHQIPYQDIVALVNY